MLVHGLRCVLIVACAGAVAVPCLGQTPDFGCGFSIPCRLPSARVARILARHVNFAGITDSETTLENALEGLGVKFNVCFDLSERAFRAEGIEEVLKCKVAEQPIPRLDNVPLSNVMHTILARIPVSSKATFYLERDTIVVTTRAHAALVAWAELKRETKALVHTAQLVRLSEPLDHAEDIGSLLVLVTYWNGIMAENAKGIAQARFDPTGLSWLKRCCGFGP